MINNKAHKIISSIIIFSILIIIIFITINNYKTSKNRAVLNQSEMYAENPNRNQVRNTLKKHLLVKNYDKSNKTNINNADFHEHNKYVKKRLWNKINEICPDCTNKKEIYNSVMQKYYQNKELLKSSASNSFDSIKKYSIKTYNDYDIKKGISSIRGAISHITKTYQENNPFISK